MSRLLPFLATVGLLCGTTLAQAELTLSSSLNNRYVTEGIDNLSEANAVQLSEIELAFHAWTLGAAAVNAFGEDYLELNFFLQYNFLLDDWEAALGITRLTYPQGDDPSSWEIYAVLEAPLGEHLLLYFETYYDVTEGGFAELGLAAPVENEQLSIEPYILLGIDYGFVEDGSRTLNHTQIGLAVSYALTKDLELTAGVHHSWALANLRGLDLGDVTWAEAGLQLSF